MSSFQEAQICLQHISKEALVATLGTEPQSLLLKAALEPFQIKVSPTASYGSHFFFRKTYQPPIYQHRVRPGLLKRIMGLHLTTRDWRVHLLASTFSLRNSENGVGYSKPESLKKDYCLIGTKWLILKQKQ